ncbi:MAG: hypothetical protein M3295_02695, partial [Chloroflexota bacterium]|nr:hypothetical protein [Chloroflexota bacterium]
VAADGDGAITLATEYVPALPPDGEYRVAVVTADAGAARRAMLAIAGERVSLAFDDGWTPTVPTAARVRFVSPPAE